MTDETVPRSRYGEAFWRTHHEAWKRSDLNQREYCEAQGLSLKAFGNSRAKFKSEPQMPARKLLYRRGGASHTPGHGSYPSLASFPGPVVPPPCPGHWRRFSEDDKRHILVEADAPAFVDVEIVDVPGADGEVSP